MKTRLTSLLVPIALALLASFANAQRAAYTFTGTRNLGDTYFGETISGTAVLDLSGPNADVFNFQGFGEVGRWSGGEFSIELTSDTGYTAGNSQGGTTSMAVYDFPFFPSSPNIEYQLYWWFFTPTGFRNVIIDSFEFIAEDGFATIPNPWQPLNLQYHWVRVEEYDYVTFEHHFAQFLLESFDPKPLNIVIDGFDTGLADFTFEGQSVAEIISGYASSATNHGGFVSAVNKLAAKLRKAGLITKDQANLLGNKAASSTIGKP